MTLPTRVFAEQYIPAGLRLPLLLLTALFTSAITGFIVAWEPILALGLVGIIVLVYAFLAWPHTSTLAVQFILYTNAAVVAVQFHGVPFIVGASVPLLLVIPLAHYLIVRREKVYLDLVGVLLILYLGVQLAGALLAQNFRVSIEESLVFIIEGLGLYLLILNVVRTWTLLRLAIWTLLIAGFLLGGLSFYQYVTETYDNDYGGFAQMSDAAFRTGEQVLQGDVEQRRLAGPLGQQNRYAQIMVMLVPLSLFSFLSERSGWLRAVAITATGFILVGTILTFSRGAAVGLVLMLLVMTALRYIKLYQFALVVLGLVILMQAFPQYGTRLVSLQDASSAVVENGTTGIEESDGSIQSRTTEMLAAALMFSDHPIWGVGTGMYRYNYQEYAQKVGIRIQTTQREPHTLYLGLAAENGILGLGCFLLIMFITLRDLTRIRSKWLRDHPEFAHTATGLFLALVAYLATGIFLHFAFIRYFWLIMGLAGAASQIINTKNSQEIRIR